MVCAIDFGTTFTGYALSFKSEYDADPHRMHCSRWSSSQGSRDKAPTAVLFNANMELQEFGFAALEEYTSMDNMARKKSLLFKHFKMELYKNEVVNVWHDLESHWQKWSRLWTIYHSFLVDKIRFCEAQVFLFDAFM